MLPNWPELKASVKDRRKSYLKEKKKKEKAEKSSIKEEEIQEESNTNEIQNKTENKMDENIIDENVSDDNVSDDKNDNDFSSDIEHKSNEIESNANIIENEIKDNNIDGNISDSNNNPTILPSSNTMDIGQILYDQNLISIITADQTSSIVLHSDIIPEFQYRISAENGNNAQQLFANPFEQTYANEESNTKDIEIIDPFSIASTERLSTKENNNQTFFNPFHYQNEEKIDENDNLWNIPLHSLNTTSERMLDEVDFIGPFASPWHTHTIINTDQTLNSNTDGIFSIPFNNDLLFNYALPPLMDNNDIIDNSTFSFQSNVNNDQNRILNKNSEEFIPSPILNYTDSISIANDFNTNSYPSLHLFHMFVLCFYS